MFHILNNSRTGMIAQQNKLDIISNNMVNINTHGYKKIDSSFSSLMQSGLNLRGVPTSDDIASLGGGVKITGVSRNKTQGSLQTTGNKTDIGIDGSGFFKGTDGNGQVFYTRSGAFNVDLLGRLTDKDGNLIDVSYAEGVDPSNTGLNNSNMIVDRNGVISTTDGKWIGKINLYDTGGNNSLISKGDNKFVPVSENITMFQVQSDFYQGYLEMSNVDVGQEMSEMILAQRSYQMATKGVTTADEMWSMLNNVR